MLKLFAKIILSLLILLSKLAYAKDSVWQSVLQETLTQWRIANHIPGLAVSIKISDKPIVNLYSGTITLNGKTPVTKNTLFQVGSITKTFVSAIILQLEAEGKLQIDQGIGHWFPEDPRWSTITIRQLLNMTSGINGIGTQDPYKIWQPHQLIDLAYQQPERFLPGTGWYYSNINYILAGLLIEKITQHPLSQEMQNRIIKPLHLLYTYYFPITYSAAVKQHMAHGYYNDNEVISQGLSLLGAAGSLLASLEDITFWVQKLFAGSVLKPKQLAEFMTTVKLPLQPPKPVG
jgi:D-alanyl-D-alanine carboxypeptidase